MVNEIKVYKAFYQIELKGGKVEDIPEEAYEIMRKALLEENSAFIEIGGNIYNRFEIAKVTKNELDPINELIAKQSPMMKTMIRLEEKTRGTPWTSTKHVSNFIKANSDETD